jgi:hypothetical protein
MMDGTSHQNWYQWTDGVEVLSLSGSATDASVYGFRVSPKQPEISGGEVGLDSYDVLFRLDAGTVSAPIPGDVVTDSGSVAYTVLSVVVESVGSTAVAYNCQCRKQVTTT